VEEAIERWRALGVATSREDVELSFVESVAEASARSREEIYDELLDARL
jgi:hypothetical protein